MNKYEVIMKDGTTDIVYKDNEKDVRERYIEFDGFNNDLPCKIKEVKLLKSLTNQEWTTYLEERRKACNIALLDGGKSTVWKMINGVMYVNGEKTKDKPIVTTSIFKGEKITNVEWV